MDDGKRDIRHQSPQLVRAPTEGGFDGGEAFEEVVDGVATFKGINQVLQRHTSAGKNWSATHDLRI